MCSSSLPEPAKITAHPAFDATAPLNTSLIISTTRPRISAAAINILWRRNQVTKRSQQLIPHKEPLLLLDHPLAHLQLPAQISHNCRGLPVAGPHPEHALVHQAGHRHDG